MEKEEMDGNVFCFVRLFRGSCFGLHNEKRTAVLSGQLRDEGRLVGAAEIGGAGNQHTGTVFLYDGSGDGINAASSRHEGLTWARRSRRAESLGIIWAMNF